MIRYVVRSFRRLGDHTAEFPWSSHGYLLAFTSAQGDLKWINDRMGLHNFRSNEFCSRCSCVKVGASVYETLPNFSDDPDHFTERDYTGTNLVERFSTLFSLPLTVDRVLHDTCHSQFLGSGKTTNGAFGFIGLLL